MEQNVYGSFIRDPVGIRNRNLPGGRNIMWSTDYPHSECTWPDSLKLMSEYFKGVSDAEREPIVRGNALRFYGLSN
jgi:predicted TIM-barrel fold metal-dependent hydrolase